MRVGRGEVDLIVRDGNRRVVVEVRTRRGGDVDPVEAFTPDKARQVRLLAGRLGIRRVDLIAVWVGRESVDIRWLPQAA